LARTVSGGVTVNDCLFHFAQINQPMAASARRAPAPITANGVLRLSATEAGILRSPFNRLADLYPPYGAKIARLEKMLRFLS